MTHPLGAPWRMDYILGPKPDSCVLCLPPDALSHDEERLVLYLSLIHISLRASSAGRATSAIWPDPASRSTEEIRFTARIGPSWAWDCFPSWRWRLPCFPSTPS